jgi:hypothetical protein
MEGRTSPWGLRNRKTRLNFREHDDDDDDDDDNNNISPSVIMEPIQSPSFHQQLKLNAECDHEVLRERRRPSTSFRHLHLH